MVAGVGDVTWWLFHKAEGMAEKGNACQSRAVLATLELARVPPLISERIHFSFSSSGSAAEKAPEITGSFLTCD